MIKIIKKELLILTVSIILLVLGIIFSPLKISFFILAYLILSYNIMIKIIKDFMNGKMAIELQIIIIVTLGLIYLKQYNDGITILILYKIIILLKKILLAKSQSELNYLSTLKCNNANLKLDDKIITVNIERIRVNDIIVINKNEIIPLDGYVVKGDSKVDFSILKSESNIKEITVGDNIKSGMKNLDDVLELLVTTTYNDTYLTRIHQLLPKKNDLKNKLQLLIKHIYKYYLVLTVLVLIVMGIISILKIWHFTDVGIYHLLGILLLTSCETLLLTINFNYNNSIDRCLKEGIYIRKKNIFDHLIRMKKIVFSFNEVFTKKSYKINQVIPYNISKQQFLMYTASASYYGSDLLALTLKECDHNINFNNINNYTKINNDSYQATVNNKLVLIGNKKIFFERKIKFPNIDIVGTSILVAIDNEYIGTIILEEEIKEDSFSINSKLQKYNLEMLAFLNSDNKGLMNKLNDKLDFSIQYADEVENEILALKKDNVVGYVGNNSDCLELADIGITIKPDMELIDSSDIIIENNHIETITKVLDIANQNKKNITFDLIMAGIAKILSIIFIILNLSISLILLSEIIAMIVIAIKSIIKSKQKEF